MLFTIIVVTIVYAYVRMFFCLDLRPFALHKLKKKRANYIQISPVTSMQLPARGKTVSPSQISRRAKLFGIDQRLLASASVLDVMADNLLCSPPPQHCPKVKRRL